MLHIAPTLLPLLNNHQFSVVITTPEGQKGSSLFLRRRDAIVESLRNTDRDKDIILIDTLTAVDGSEGHILFEYSPYRKPLKEKDVAELLQLALLKINHNKVPTESNFQFDKHSSIPYTAIQFGLPPNLLELKKLPIAAWEENL